MKPTRSTIIRKIRAARGIGSLRDSDRVVIAQFIAAQMVRTAQQRERLMALGRSMMQELEARGIEPEDSELWSLDPQDAEIASIESVLSSASYLPYILDKTWLLFVSTMSAPFWIRDNPVTSHNIVDRASTGRLGLKAPGVETYLPPDPTLVLALFCRSHEERIREGLRPRDPVTAARLEFGPVKEMYAAMRHGTPLPSIPANVENHNPLQVRRAERYVFSATPDFVLAEEMIRDHPEYRHGRLRVQ